jgi:hypothetical protein
MSTKKKVNRSTGEDNASSKKQKISKYEKITERNAECAAQVEASGKKSLYDGMVKRIYKTDQELGVLNLDDEKDMFTEEMGIYDGIMDILNCDEKHKSEIFSSDVNNWRDYAAGVAKGLPLSEECNDLLKQMQENLYETSELKSAFATLGDKLRQQIEEEANVFYEKYQQKKKQAKK